MKLSIVLLTLSVLPSIFISIVLISYIPDTSMRLFLLWIVLMSVVSCFLLLLFSFRRSVQMQKATLRDLEQEKKTLMIQSAKDQAILSSIADCVLVTDAKGRVILLNQRAQELFHLSPEEWKHKQISELWQVFTEKNLMISAQDYPVSQALSKGKRILTSAYRYVKGKKSVSVSSSAAPVFVKKKVIGAVEVFRDVSKEKAIEKMKNEFISLASHQLRTPLTAIRWLSEMLLSNEHGELKSAQRETVQLIADSNNRMIDLVSSLLNISRMESGRLELDPVPTNITALLHSVVQDIRPKILEKKQKLVIEVQPRIKQVILDQKLIRQLFLNLLSNAVKYTPDKGSITVRIRQRDQQLECQVQDTGYGIPESDNSRVFEKFYRGDNVVLNEPDGNGLGLYLVRSIVQSSGGKIWFESKINRGTTFYFTLPVSDSRARR